MIKIVKTHTESHDNRNFIYYQVSRGQLKIAAKILYVVNLAICYRAETK